MLLPDIPKRLVLVSKSFNVLAACAVVAMMLLTCTDVVLRLFRCPIPGTYEMVGLLGAIFVSFSLAGTSMDRGHIVVDFLVQKFPPRAQRIIEGCNCLVCAILFGIIAWYSTLYALDLKDAGETSLTLELPLYPFLLGIAVGCGLLCAVLVLQSVESFVAIGSRNGPPDKIDTGE
jgi:TRAP-type C4-dicarboxylate transport system permease small subunit